MGQRSSAATAKAQVTLVVTSSLDVGAKPKAIGDARLAAAEKGKSTDHGPGQVGKQRITNCVKLDCTVGRAARNTSNIVQSAGTLMD